MDYLSISTYGEIKSGFIFVFYRLCLTVTAFMRSCYMKKNSRNNDILDLYDKVYVG